ncbi:unnamed protein product [Brassica oleracea]|uniref:(rape) hypothetical protein n=1 Tax=Brassica napus TaxID=3708 RepID=A0A816RK08_BRANA|nr:unnamed protein product [Brassica napus]
MMRQSVKKLLERVFPQGDSSRFSGQDNVEVYLSFKISHKIIRQSPMEYLRGWSLMDKTVEEGDGLNRKKEESGNEKSDGGERWRQEKGSGELTTSTGKTI